MVFDERNNCLFCTESFPNLEISISIESFIHFMTDNLKTNWKNTYCWFHLLSAISNTYLAPASAVLTAFSLIVAVKKTHKNINEELSLFINKCFVLQATNYGGKNSLGLSIILTFKLQNSSKFSWRRWGKKKVDLKLKKAAWTLVQFFGFYNIK